MLVLTFHLGGERFGLPVDLVREVLAWPSLRQLPSAPDYVAGMLNYHGELVPVIDLNHLTGALACRPLMSSRIMLVSYGLRGGTPRLLGLLAQGVVGTSKVDPIELTEHGLKLDEAPYLGQLVVTGGETMQLVDIAKLLTPEVENLLFADSPG
jgi:chemotaxis-related protein WspB